MSSNEAAWVDAAGKPIRVGSAEMYKPGPGQILLKNHAVALNIIDYLKRDLGLLAKEWPVILGEDVAGEVVELGEGVTEFSKGQRVIAHAVALLTNKNENAAFQKYTVVPASSTAVIPDDLEFEYAVVIPLCFSTAAMGLYLKDFLNLPLPSTNPQKSGKTILIWGGSSGVGSAAIQLAIASGLEVITTASKHNFDYCKSLGAKEVFDHSSSTILEDLTASLKDVDLVGAYDAIAKPDTTATVAKLLEQRGGGFIASVMPLPDDLPSKVKGTQVFASILPVGHPELSKSVYHDFLPAALKSGQYKPAPKAEILGKGLENLQFALDKLKQGVSASKIVVSI